MKECRFDHTRTVRNIAMRIATSVIIGGNVGYTMATSIVSFCYEPLMIEVINEKLEVLNGGTVLHAICSNRPFYTNDESFAWEISPDSLSEQVNLAVDMWVMLRRQGAEIILDGDGCFPWDKKPLEYVDTDFVLQMAICNAIGQLEISRTAEQNPAGAPVSSLPTEISEDCNNYYQMFNLDYDDCERFELDC